MRCEVPGSRLAAGALLAVLGAFPFCGNVNAAATLTGEIAAALAREPDPRWGPQVAGSWPLLKEFYAGRNWAPLWLKDGSPTRRAAEAVELLRAADRDGLDAGHYGADRLAGELSAPASAGALEVSITSQFLHFLAELRHGRFPVPRAVDGNTHLVPAIFEPLTVLRRIAAAADLAAIVHEFVPGNAPYRGLRRGLSKHRAIAANGGWPTIPAGPALKPGGRDERVPVLRRRLAVSEDLVGPEETAEPMLYDSVLADSVIRFQRRHGLEPDGIVGRNTLSALNIPVGHRIEQISLNMERWRWMPDDLGDRHILVNLAGFELDLVEYGSVVMDMRIIVGRPYRRTPVFTGMMSYLELSPTWTVPPTILREDLLPQQRKDPGYLEGKGIEVYEGWGPNAARLDPRTVNWNDGTARLASYRYVQPPGPQNALGRVKFMFPNPHSIYLHDTPERGLFARANRALSSGCIRVQRPLDLAVRLLADQPAWNRETIERAMAQPRPTRVNLTRSVPVHLTYVTAWIGEGGTYQFRPDVYGRDTTLQESIAAAVH